VGVVRSKRYNDAISQMYRETIEKILGDLDRLVEEYEKKFGSDRYVRVLIDEGDWGKLVAVFRKRDKKFLKFDIIFNDRYVVP